MQHNEKSGSPELSQRRTFEERAQWTADLFLRLQQAEIAKTGAIDAQRKAYARAHGRHDPADLSATQQ